MKHQDPMDAARDQAVDKLIDDANERDADKLREHVRILRAGLKLFCDRRDRGEIQSSTTYKQFKQLLEMTK